MSYLVLARKYRPKTFEEVVQQEHVTKTLANSIKAKRVAHAILFTGTRGTGKTTIARILAKAMNCEEGTSPIPCNVCGSCKEIAKGYSPDVIEIDGASNNKVENVRELIDNAKYMPSRGRFKIYIIDEVHMLSTSAFNALLKTLEEPPAHILFFLATTEPRKIPITILSRCQRHDLRRVDNASMIKFLAFVSESEGIEIDEETLNMIAREGAGSVRDSLSLLDHVISGSTGKVLYQEALDALFAVDRKIVFSFAQALIGADIKRALTILNDVYLRGSDVKIFYKEIISHFRDLILIKMEKSDIVDAPALEIEMMIRDVDDKEFLYLNRILEFLLKEESSINFSNNPKLFFETLLIRFSYVKPVMSVDSLVEKLDLLYDETRKREPLDYDRKPLGRDETVLEESSAIYNNEEKKVSDYKKKDDEIEKKEDDEIDIKDKDELWSKVLKSIEKDAPATASYLEGSFPVELSDDMIKIGITANKVVIDRLNFKKSIKVIESAIFKVAKKRLKAVIDGKILNDKDNGSVRLNRKDIESKALSHRLVQEAMEIFDGRLKSVRIL